MIELYENQQIENDLGTFEGFNHKTQEAIYPNVTAQEMLDWDHDGRGEAEFWHSGDNPGVAYILDSDDVLPRDMVALDQLLSVLGNDNTALAKIAYLIHSGGYRLQELDAGTVEDSSLWVFIDQVPFIDLRRSAAYELFETYYPEEYRAWDQSTCDGLIFDFDLFLDSPAFSTDEFQIGEDRVLIVDPR
jgi:hypothetical protein